MKAADLLAAAQRQSGATDRTARYAARLDAHLPTLADDGARAAFLAREFENWTVNYRTWAHDVDNGDATQRQLTYSAWDFTETLAAIAQRQAKYAADRVPA